MEITSKTYKHVFRFFEFLRPYKTQGIFLFLGFAFDVLIQLPLPLLTMYLIDEALINGNHQVYYLIISLLVLATVLQLTINYFTYRWLVKIRLKVMIDLKSALYNKIQKLPLSFFQKNSPGSIISRLTHDVNASEALLFESISYFFLDFLQLLIVSGILFYLNFKMALLTTFSIPLYILSLRLYNKKIRRLGRKKHFQEARTLGILGNMITSMRLIKSFVNEAYELRKFKKSYNQLIKSRIQLNESSLLSDVYSRFFASMGPILVLMYGGMEIINHNLTIGQLVAFTAFLGYLYDPIKDLTLINSEVQAAVSPINRVFEILDKPSENYMVRKVCPTFEKGELLLQSVWFAYEEKYVLKNINLHIPAKTSLAIVGDTGAGKSTLVQLISRFYDPQKGEIYIDNYNLKELPHACIRQQIGEVTQKKLLIQGTIRENIGYGDLTASEGKIIKAAKLSGAHDHIMNLPQRYDTLIGPQSQTISNGLLQMIALARAIIKPRSLLIFDETTTVMDPDISHSIKNTLEHLRQQSTIIYIAHNLATLEQADQIAVLDKGQIIQCGPHAKLYADKKGIYRQLYDSLSASPPLL